MGITVTHVAISLIGIAAGLVSLAGMLGGRRLDGWTAAFLASTIATSVSGFAIAADRVLPSHVVGALSLLVLAAAVYARYRRDLAGRWRIVYVVTAVLALYLNVFVGVIQAFLKVPALHGLAPTQAEPPFVVAQLAVLATFAGLAVAAVVRFRPQPRPRAARSHAIPTSG
jgi:hypothetical protein